MSEYLTPTYYKAGTGWTAITADALYSTYGGTCQVDQPLATEYTGDGYPCAAVGAITITMRMPWMSDTGMAFWRSRFAAHTDSYASVDISIFDWRRGSYVKLAGRLRWPTFESTGLGSTAGSTMYRNVEVRIENCSTSSY